ncbi:MAG TPA: hypothetical protein VFJ14_17905 [Nocardioidaceae bacterium]|nr:hypothetical protein [Nocardioidaceae bacterium]
MTRLTRALRALAAHAASYIVAREPVRTAGWLAGVVLGVIGWFAVPSGQTEQIVQTVCGVLGPIVAAELSRLAAWSPQSHADNVIDAAAAYLAGWNPTDGKAPNAHTLPPPVDPALGNNGIPPTGAEQVA